MRRVSYIVCLLAASAALGQNAPPARVGASGAGTRAGVATRGATPTPGVTPAAATGAGRAGAGVTKNLDRALQDPITIDAEAMGCGKFGDMLRDMTQTNLVINWNAFAKAGITRETPVTLHLKDVPFEQAVRTLMEVLPATGTRANYTVGENTLEITTNADLGKGSVSRLFDVARATAYSFNATAKPEEVAHNAAVLDVILRAELARAGEPMDVPEHGLVFKNGTMAATVSERGMGFVNRAIIMFNQPIKVGQLATGTQLNVWAKRTTDAYHTYMASPGAALPAAMAKEPQKYSLSGGAGAGKFNIALLPGTAEELAKAKPDISAAINDGGVLLLGPREVMRARTLLAVYDLRDLMKKLASKSKVTPLPDGAAFQSAIVQVLQTTIKPEGDTWGGGDDLGKKPAVLVPYNGLLVVFATAEAQRTVAGALQDMNK